MILLLFIGLLCMPFLVFVGISMVGMLALKLLPFLLVGLVIWIGYKLATKRQD